MLSKECGQRYRERQKDKERKWQKEEEEAEKASESPCRTQNIFFCCHANESRCIHLKCCFWTFFHLVVSVYDLWYFGESNFHVWRNVKSKLWLYLYFFAQEPKRPRVVSMMTALGPQYSEKPPYGMWFGYSVEVGPSIPPTAVLTHNMTLNWVELFEHFYFSVEALSYFKLLLWT